MASIRKRTWTSGGEVKQAWVCDYFDQGGRRHLKTFTTRKAADAWLVTARIEVKEGIHTRANKSCSVAEAGEQWIAQGETDGLERSTTDEYRRHVVQHIAPFIGAVRLAELTPARVQSFRNDLLSQGRSRVMAAKVVGSLGSVLAHAMSTGQVARNVVRDQQRNSKRQRQLEKRHSKQIEVGVDIPTKGELRAIMAAAQGKARVLLVVAIFTGLRASELRGLRWADVDLEHEVLTVRQRADRWGTLGSPKSDAAKRTVPLAPIAVSALREWRLSCPKGPQDFVFPNGKGNVELLTNLHKRVLGPLQVVAGVAEPSRDDAKGRTVLRPKYGMHAFRHAAASLFIEQGLSPKRIQSLMGHSTIQMTFDTYGHLFPSTSEDQAAMRQIQARLVG